LKKKKKKLLFRVIETIKLLLGLGNPGNAYFKTRHNMGFMAIDSLISLYGLKEENENSLTWWGKTEIKTHEIIVAKPLTFMNLSGEAALWLMSYFKISPSQILIIHDDMDISWGKIKIVKGGGSGGHKGVSSIQDYLKTKNIPRLKIGIGRPPTKNAINYVLSEFSSKEKEELKIIFKQVCIALTKIITEGLEKAMSFFNSKNLLKEGN